MASTQIDLIRERIDIVDLIGQRVKLRQSGRSLKGLCPFHNEKTPSFVVYPDSQHFHCFGCGKSGDAFSFVMAMDNLDFPDALKVLAQRAGVDLESQAPRKDPERDKTRERLLDLNDRAAAFFANMLWSSEAGAPARELLDRRGVDRKTAEQFGLGFAADSFDALKRYFTSRDVSAEELVEAGLLIAREDGHTWDRFRNRLMFPIRDREGHTLGFGARAIGSELPKYLNSPETATFDKRSVLYALDRAYDEIRRQRSIVIVEGYMDAIAAHQFGYSNVVASMGTAVTTTQIGQIRRYLDRVYLALDADAAGQLAAIRGIDALRSGLADEERTTVSGRGVVRFERTIGAEIRIVALPHGKDPDELIRSDAAAWVRALSEAVPVVEYYLVHALDSIEPTPAARAKALQEVAVPVLREIPDATVLAHYMGLTARLLGYKDTDVHAAILRGSVIPGPVRPSRTAPLRPEDRPLAHDPERYLFALAIRYPEIARSQFASLDLEDVHDVRNQLISVALTGSGELTEAGDLDLPEELAEYIDALRDDLGRRPSQTPGAAFSEIGAAMQRLAQARLDSRMRHVQSEIQSARSAGDAALLMASLEQMNELAMRKSEFDPRTSPYFKDSRSDVS